MLTPTDCSPELLGPTVTGEPVSDIQLSLPAAVYVNVSVPELLMVRAWTGGLDCPCWAVNDNSEGDTSTVPVYPSRPNICSLAVCKEAMNSLLSSPNAIPIVVTIGFDGF